MSDDGVTLAIAAPESPNPGAEEIREKAGTLWDLVGQITGNSGDMRAVFTAMEGEFSDVVRDDISSQANYDESKWREVAWVLFFGAYIADEWSDDVATYDESRTELYDDVVQFLTIFRARAPWFYQIATGLSPYEDGSYPVAAVAPLGPTGDEGFYNVRNVGVPTSMYIAWRDAKIRDKIREYHSEAETLKEELVDSGNSHVRKLKLGPEHDPTIQQLVESGDLGWAPFNIRGVETNPPLPISGDDAAAAARDFNDYAHGGKEVDARYYEVLGVISALKKKSLVLQSADDRMDRATTGPGPHVPSRYTENNLHANELEYLEEFLAHLEDENSSDDETTMGGVAFLPRWIEEDPYLQHEGYGYLDEEEKSSMVAALGDGLLMLSNEELGGGAWRLPESVNNMSKGIPSPVVNGAQEYPEGDEMWGWLEQADYLEQLLGAADPDLRGGREFSSNLNGSIGHHIHGLDNDNRSFDPALMSLLEVGSRNDDANSNIVEGYNHPNFDENDNALIGLYTHNWLDDGTAVAGVTDWIPDAKESADASERDRAQRSVLALVELIGSDDHEDAWRKTGIPNPDENAEGDLTFGAANPELAQSLAGVAVAYQDEFSNKADTDDFGVSDDGSMEMPYRARRTFLTHVVADSDSAVLVLNSANYQDFSAVERAVEGENEGQVHERNAVFRSLVDSALHDEVWIRMEAEVDAYEEAVKEDEFGENMFGQMKNLGIVFSSAPQAKIAQMASLATVLMGGDLLGNSMYGNIDKPEFDEVVEAGPDDPRHPFHVGEDYKTYAPSKLRDNISLMAVQKLIDDDYLDPAELREKHPDLMDGDEVVSYVTQHPDDDWGSVSASLDDVLNETPWCYEGFPDWTAQQFVDNYTRAYAEKYDESYNPKKAIPGGGSS